MAEDNGLEGMYQLHKGALSTPSDAALLFVHWVLVQNGFRVQIEQSETTSHSTILTSDSAAVTSDSSRVTSELLPEGWAGQQVCTLQYSAGDCSTSYLLKALTVDQQLVVNMIKQTSGTEESRMRTFSVVVADLVGGSIDRYHGLYSRPGHFRSQVEECLLREPSDSASSGGTSSSTTTTVAPSSQSSNSPQYTDPLRLPSTSSRRPPFTGDPLAVGGADLDPFGGGLGGGMLMDPRGFRPAHAPSWVPPGARFDPFAPSGLRPRRPGPQFPGEPDFDHMRPPDHFM